MIRDSAATPNCPRCGYDLSGAVDSWNDCCPLEGVCPECGIGLSWGYVLHPSSRMAPWYVESNSPLRVTIPRTAIRAFVPWLFWRSLPIELPMRPWRLAKVVVLWWLILQCVLLVTVLGLEGWDWVRNYRSGMWWGWRDALGEYLKGFRDEDPVELLLLMTITPFFAAPLLYAVLGNTLGRAKVRRNHLWRISGASFFLFPISGWIIEWSTYGIYQWDWDTEVVGSIAILSILTWTPALLTVFWGYAGSRYLKIRRPWLVATVLGFTSGLAGISIPMLIAELFYFHR